MEESANLEVYEIVENKVKPGFPEGLTVSDIKFFIVSLFILVIGGMSMGAAGVNKLWAIPLFAAFVLLNMNVPGTHWGHLWYEIWMGFKGWFFVHLVLKDIVFLADPERVALIGQCESLGLEIDPLWTNEELREMVVSQAVKPATSYLGLRQRLRERRYVRNPARRSVLPLSLQFVSGGGRQIGVLHQHDTGLGHLFVFADGSLYHGLDYKDQQDALSEYSAAINRFIARTSEDVGITQLRVTRPNDHTQAKTMLLKSGDPFMTSLGNFDISDQSLIDWIEWRQENFGHIQATVDQFGGSKNWMAVVVTFSWRRVWERASQGKLTDEQIAELMLVDMGRALVEELSGLSIMEIQNPHIATADELAFFIKSAFDPYGLPEYYEQRTMGTVPTSDDEYTLITKELVEQFPETYDASDIGSRDTRHIWDLDSIEVMHDRIRVGDTWFMVVRETQLPESLRTDTAQRVHTLLPPGSWHSFAAVSQKTSGSVQAEKTLIGESFRRSMGDARRQQMNVEHPKHKRRSRKVDKYVDQITMSSNNQRYHRLHVLAAPESKLLDQQLRDLVSAGAQLAIRMQVVKGRARLVDALVTAILGCNRL